ncbi:MAG: class I SAM-dependent methyltransferase [Methyloceanibacter sp.]
MTPRDIGLFLMSARTDATIARLGATNGARAAFEAVYSRWNDTWASASPRYRYQRRKYEQVVGMLSGRRFRRGLDLGCGLGLLAQLLAPQVDELLGLDIAEAAIDRARQREAAFPNLRYEQADLLDLPRTLDRSFDLVLVVNTLYYLSPLDDETLKGMALRVADLIVPGGLCVLVNHYFFAADSASRISRRMHRTFSQSLRFRLTREQRKPFFWPADQAVGPRGCRRQGGMRARLQTIDVSITLTGTLAMPIRRTHKDGHDHQHCCCSE